MIHNYYQKGGGEDKSFEAEAAVLEEHGHQVIRYTKHNDTIHHKNALVLAIEALWNHSVYRELRSLIRSSRPDIVHCHNTFPLLSPAVYYAASAENVPVVQSLRNYRLLCANGIFFRNGHVCEACLGKSIPWPGVRYACYRNSYSATVVTSLMMVFHRALHTWNNRIDVYITLSEFARKKFIEGGIPSERIIVKPNFVPHDPQIGQGQKKYALFVGRLNPEKGILTLLRAWEQLGSKIPLKILGDGMLAGQVQEAASRLEQIEWLGEQSIEQVYAYMGEAAFLIFPSESYETFGRVAIEAFAKGTPVVAAGIGAVGEVTRHGITGLHFRPGDVEDLIEKIEWLLSHPSELATMRKKARIEYETKYNAERNYELTLTIYASAVASHGVGRGKKAMMGV